MTWNPTISRDQILTALSTRLTTHYPPDVGECIRSMISGTLAELDALPPYPSESDFQKLLSAQVYPFIAACQALDMEGEDCEVLKALINDIVPVSV